MKESRPKELPLLRRRGRPMPNAKKSEPQLKPQNWLNKKCVKPKSALKERPEASLSQPTKLYQRKNKMPIAMRKRKLQQNHERTRLLPKK